MSQDYHIIETEKELDACNFCPLFTMDGEVHLAKVIKCYDGDTIHCIFKHNGKYTTFHVRLYGYDSPEMKPSITISYEKRKQIKAKAQLAKKRLEDLILNKNVYLFCMEFDKYGRLLGKIKINLDDRQSVNDLMIEEDHGYAYFGGTKEDQLEN